jgi:hypothetical protein
VQHHCIRRKTEKEEEIEGVKKRKMKSKRRQGG